MIVASESIPSEGVRRYLIFSDVILSEIVIDRLWMIPIAIHDNCICISIARTASRIFYAHDLQRPAPAGMDRFSSGSSSALAYILTRSGNRMPRFAVSAPGTYIRYGNGNCTDVLQSAGKL